MYQLVLMFVFITSVMLKVLATSNFQNSISHSNIQHSIPHSIMKSYSLRESLSHSRHAHKVYPKTPAVVK